MQSSHCTGHVEHGFAHCCSGVLRAVPLPRSASFFPCVVPPLCPFSTACNTTLAYSLSTAEAGPGCVPPLLHSGGSGYSSAAVRRHRRRRMAPSLHSAACRRLRSSGLPCPAVTCAALAACCSADHAPGLHSCARPSRPALSRPGKRCANAACMAPAVALNSSLSASKRSWSTFVPRSRCLARLAHMRAVPCRLRDERQNSSRMPCSAGSCRRKLCVESGAAGRQTGCMRGMPGNVLWAGQGPMLGSRCGLACHMTDPAPRQQSPALVSSPARAAAQVGHPPAAATKGKEEQQGGCSMVAHMPGACSCRQRLAQLTSSL